MRGAEGRLARLAVLAVVVLAACSPPGGDTGGAEGGERLEAAAGTASTSGVGAAVDSARRTLAAQHEDRVAMEQVDARFPHSEHRAIECRRCHQRPPGHQTHLDAPCNACHGRPVGFAGLPERTPAECASCHHRDVGPQDCRSCHTADQVGPTPVLVSVKAAGAAEGRVRRITFDHGDHAGRACTSCHTTPGTLQFGVDCGTCHEAHHTQTAPCMTCHESVGPPTHTAAVHAGCGGGGCHGDAPVLDLTPTRNVCLGCHQDLVEHKPGQECTACHRAGWTTLRGRPSAAGGRP